MMQWTVRLEARTDKGEVKTAELVTFRRPAVASTVAEIGLTLAEAKALLTKLQASILCDQLAEYAAHRRGCPDCGVLQPLKDRRTRRRQTLFGTVDRRRPAREDGGASDLPQRLSRPDPRHPAGHAPASYPEAPGRAVLLPALPGAPENVREGAGGRDPRSLDWRRLNAAFGRAGPGHGSLRDQQEPGQQALQGHRRARERLPGSPAQWRVALPLAGRHLPEAA